MLTKTNRGAFNWLLACACVGLLAGCKPPGPKALLDGKRLLEKGRVTEAVERLQVATDLLATNAQAWNYLGVAYHQSGQVSNAVIAYKRAIAVNPDLMEARLNLGTLWLDLGRHAEAKQEFIAYTLRRPNSSEALQNLATAELHLREFLSAEQHLLKAIKLQDSAEAWNALGLVQIQQRHPRDAAQSFASSLKRRPDFAPAVLNLAIVSHQQLGDRQAALKWYRQYLELQPRPADAAAVTLVARQLELELAPPKPAPPSPTPSLPSPTQTVVKTAPTSPPPPRAVAAGALPAASASAAVPKPAPVDPKPVSSPPAARSTPTVVTLAPEPEIRAAPIVESKAPAASQPAAPKPDAAKAGTPTLAEASKQEKKGLLQSINPVNLFKSDPRKQQVTPSSGSNASSAPGLDKTLASTPSSAPVDSAGGRDAKPAGTLLAGGSRYQYRGAGNTSPGDRAAAAKLAAQGANELAAKNYALASQRYAAAAQADPSWFQAHFIHAAAALEAGQTTEALAAGETALALQPDSADARYNFALALKRADYPLDAAIQLERLLAVNSNDVRAHLALGNFYADQLKRPDLARVHFLRVIELDPKNPRASDIHFWLKENPKK